MKGWRDDYGNFRGASWGVQRLDDNATQMHGCCAIATAGQNCGIIYVSLKAEVASRGH